MVRERVIDGRNFVVGRMRNGVTLGPKSMSGLARKPSAPVVTWDEAPKKRHFLSGLGDLPDFSSAIHPRRRRGEGKVPETWANEQKPKGGCSMRVGR